MMELNLVVCYFPLQTIYRDSAVRVPIMGLLLCYSFIMVIRLIESNIENGLSNLSKQKITIRLFEQQKQYGG